MKVFSTIFQQLVICISVPHDKENIGWKIIEPVLLYHYLTVCTY